jgi:hypothetical protein
MADRHISCRCLLSTRREIPNGSISGQDKQTIVPHGSRGLHIMADVLYRRVRRD